MQPLFTSTKHTATPAALEALDAAKIPAREILDRHFSGDWGETDPGDALMNRDEIYDGGRILSNYILPATGVEVWVLTEQIDDDGVRQLTTILLPEEY